MKNEKEMILEVYRIEEFLKVFGKENCSGVWEKNDRVWKLSQQ